MEVVQAWIEFNVNKKSWCVYEINGCLPGPSLGKYRLRMVVQNVFKLSRCFKWCCSRQLGSWILISGAKWPNTYASREEGLRKTQKSNQSSTIIIWDAQSELKILHDIKNTQRLYNFLYRTYESPKKNLFDPRRWERRFRHSRASR